MGRPRKPPAPYGPYIIQTQPLLKPPQGNGVECTEPCHWYYAPPGWVRSKKHALVIESASDAVRQIGDLRHVIMGVEFTLVPIDGSLFFKPI
jgi:hypothetical protein